MTKFLFRANVSKLAFLLGFSAILGFSGAAKAEGWELFPPQVAQKAIETTERSAAAARAARALEAQQAFAVFWSGQGPFGAPRADLLLPLKGE